MKRIRKIIILLITFFLYSTGSVLAEGLVDVVNIYSNDNNDVERTLISDRNCDGIYDTYIIIWSADHRDTYPILAIGDIRRWPPHGVAITTISYVDPEGHRFVENYFSNNNSNLRSWFSKPEGVDTVFFYDSSNEMQSLTDVGDANLQLTFTLMPNPVRNLLNIHFETLENGWVDIKLYNEIGVIIDKIDESYRYSGNYDLSYSTNDLANGVYFLSLRLGQNTVITRRIVIMK